ncbi:MAG: cytochrome b/b6 domain-containing protein [Methanosarcinaceae archaeon]|nr:cytochrome b/b6 domain-containing protein [Methanosarcinaceae archaeon]
MTKTEPNIERFNLNQRLQHAVLAVSCLILFITGLLIKFPDDLGYFAMLLGGFEVTTTMHRFAGGGILVLCIFHPLYYLFNREWMKTKEILPGIIDVKNIIADTLYIVGLSKKGQYKKYAYREKLDYWGAIIFFPILVVTGIALWFPIFFVQNIAAADYLPAMRVIHTMDAILAGMAVMMHMYNVHLNPEFFPANWTMFTGQISPKRAEEEFPLWYESVINKNEE